MAMVTLASWSIVSAGAAGDTERQYLREAANGNLEHVFLIRHLGGYVAFPRTFIVFEVFGKTNNVIFRVNGSKDASLVDAGLAIPSVYFTTRDKKKQDTVTGHSLPSNPSHAEMRGSLRIDYFEPQGEWSQRTVMIYDETFYLLLTGSATIVANELVKAFVAINGPPDVFASGWQPVATWVVLPPWNQVKQSTMSAETDCISGVIVVNMVFSGGSKNIRWRILPGVDVESFRATRFAAGDIIELVDDRPIALGDNLRSLLREAANGRRIVFAIERRGLPMKLVMTPEVARTALSRCQK